MYSQLVYPRFKHEYRKVNKTLVAFSQSLVDDMFIHSIILKYDHDAAYICRKFRVIKFLIWAYYPYAHKTFFSSQVISA